MALDPEVIQRLEKDREICCSSWGIPPWEFDAAMAAGLITVTHIRRARERWFASLPEDAKPYAREWLYPGITQRDKERAEAEAMARTWIGFPFDAPGEGVNNGETIDPED